MSPSPLSPRYLAIVHHSSKLSQQVSPRTSKIITVIWTLSLLSAAPWAMLTKVLCIGIFGIFFWNFVQVNFLQYNGKKLAQSSWCSIPFNEETVGSLYMSVATTFVYFVLPSIIVSYMYIRWTNDNKRKHFRLRPSDEVS